MQTDTGNDIAKTAATVVVTKDMGKTYHLGIQDLHVLREINLTIKAGEYVAVMGPSGSGKSTLLNLLGCLDQPSQGQYFLSGSDVSNLDDDELSHIRGARIGFIFQSYNLIAQLNVMENIEVPMFYQGISESRSRVKAQELAEMVGLGDRLTHRPAELSGGQQQRVAIARAMINDPVILLADEPTGNLDSQSGHDILHLLDALHEQGKTLIIVTHDDYVAARAEKVIHLLDGQVEKIVTNGNSVS
jgi:putative ABC transport system ATP-binding protein